MLAVKAKGDRSGLRRTLTAVADDAHGANDVVAPGVAALLNSKKVIFLLVVEDVLWAFIARHVFQ